MTEQLLQMMQQPKRISTNTQNINTHVIKLWSDIGFPDEYQDEIDLIESAYEHDVIVLDLCTDGGVLDSAALFNRALRSTAAHTVAIIGPSCSSAGSVIALSCREFVLDNTSSLMLHTSSYSIRGKDVDILEHATFSRRSLRRLYEEVYRGFLTEEEIEDVIKGKPFYFDAENLEERLSNLHEYREAMESNCDCEECQEAAENPPFNILDAVEERVEAGIQKALDAILKKHDLVPKPEKAKRTPKAKATPKPVNEIIEK
jgi:ATP-dependent protease ClpP protease subunit